MERVILHSDLNNFYASVECLHNPQLRELPVVVGGDQDARHGIVLAKNYHAKKYQIQTGEALWQAKEKCPSLVIVPANFPLYLRFARLAKNIYYDYTDQVESFGIDEAWLDVTGSIWRYGSGQAIADEIRGRISLELGLTASVGVSWNKIFAKLGSDMKKPNATTVIDKTTYKDTVWPLPSSELLYVGKATYRKLYDQGIRTIGDIACNQPKRLRAILGKWGETLWGFANGYDQSPVSQWGEESPFKSIGNSTTTPRDLESEEDVKMVVTVLAESVAMRMRENGLKCKTVAIQIRDKELNSTTRQVKLKSPSNVSTDLIREAMALFQHHYSSLKPIRSVGLKGADLINENQIIQLTLFEDAKQVQKEALEKTIDDIRQRFGNYSICKGVVLQDKALTSFNPKAEHTIHPVNYFK